MSERLGEGHEEFELLLCFKRLLKLILLGVRPVFVFEGRTPDLKRRTLMERFKARYKSERNYKKLAQRMIMNQLEKRPNKRKSRTLEDKESSESKTIDESNIGAQMTADEELEVLKMLEEYEAAVEEREFEDVSLANTRTNFFIR